MTDLLAVEEAQRVLLDSASPLGTEVEALAACVGRVIGQDLRSAIDVPPFANSAMDGFALRANDTNVAAGTVTLRVIGGIRAGSVQLLHVGTGDAVRIMTGAPIPPGADTVVPFEDTTTDDDSVTVPSHVPTGACIRPAGLDVKAGALVLEAGARLSSAQIAVAASIGADRLSVFRRPRVAILATGDELAEVGQPLQPGQIYNSNAYGLHAAVTLLGAEPQVLKPAHDDRQAIRDTLQGLEGIDLVISSGGVSVGDHDYIRLVVEELGSIDFWRIRMRPGKPLMVGSLKRSDGTRLRMLGLPGNPTSTMVTFHVFARPLILRMMGAREVMPSSVRAVTENDLDNRGGRDTYFRVVLDLSSGQPRARLSGGQDSSMLLTLARATGLARVRAEIEHVQAGDVVDVFPVA
jgi:molybdopterin molybdotransferase